MHLADIQSATALYGQRLEIDQHNVTEGMEPGHQRTISFTKSSSVVACSDEAKTSETDVEEQLGDGDALLRCFSPLLSSMRVFGLYFTHASRRIHDVSSMTPISAVPRNRGRIYAVIILVVFWLNVARILSMFDKTDKFAYDLFLKLTLVSAALFGAVLQTACFVGCQTGNLDRVFLDARLPKSDHIRYRRLAMIHAIACWILVVTEMLIFTVSLFFEEELHLSMTPFGNHIVVSGWSILLLKLFVLLQYFFIYGEWIFPQSLNYM